MENVKWVFFDLGSTLIDETAACEFRIRETIAETEVSFEQFYEKMIELAGQNLKGDSEAFDFFSLQKKRGIRKWKYPTPMHRRFWSICGKKAIRSASSRTSRRERTHG